VPGRVGRAPRTYELARGEVSVRLPERHPEVLGSILVEAIVRLTPGESVAPAAQRVACERGTGLGAAHRARIARPGRIGPERAAGLARSVLAESGYEPYPAP